MKITNIAFGLAFLFLATAMSSMALADGNIVAEFNGGDLDVEGENNTEQAFALEGTGAPGSIRVLALDPDTTINGLPFVEFNGVNGDVTIDLRSGPKVLIMTEGTSNSLLIGGDLEIKNRGNDAAVMLLDEVEVAGRLDIKTKNGDDALIMNGNFVQSRTRINTGNGNDVIQVGFDSEFVDELEVKSGGGDDVFMLFVADVFGELDVKMGGQNDTVGLYSSIVGDASITVTVGRMHWNTSTFNPSTSMNGPSNWNTMPDCQQCLPKPVTPTPILMKLCCCTDSLTWQIKSELTHLN